MKSKLSLSRMGMRGSVVLIIIGVFILSLGIIVDFNGRRLPDNAGETKAEITAFITDSDSKIESTSTVVSYTVNGKRYDNVVLKQYQASWEKGDKIDICYNIDKPVQVWTKTMQYSGLMIVIFSVPFLAIGLYKIIQFARIRVKSQKEVSDEYDEENEMDAENGMKFKISTVIIPFAAGVPFTLLGLILGMLNDNRLISLIITTLGVFAILAGIIALINFICKKQSAKSKSKNGPFHE